VQRSLPGSSGSAVKPDPVPEAHTGQGTSPPFILQQLLVFRVVLVLVPAGLGAKLTAHQPVQMPAHAIVSNRDTGIQVGFRV
jgi:hypothetical protein